MKNYQQNEPRFSWLGSLGLIALMITLMVIGLMGIQPDNATMTKQPLAVDQHGKAVPLTVTTNDVSTNPPDPTPSRPVLVEEHSTIIGLKPSIGTRTYARPDSDTNTVNRLGRQAMSSVHP